MSRILNLIFLFILFIVSSCMQADKPSLEVKYTAVRSAIENQIIAYEQSSAILEKRMTVNGKESKSVQQQINWQKELAEFLDADLNKPAWRDSYSIDSSWSVGVLTIKYTAVDKKMKIKNMEIQVDSLAQLASTFSYLYFEKEVENGLYHYQQTAFYVPFQRFEIATSQKVRFLKETRSGVKGLILRR